MFLFFYVFIFHFLFFYFLAPGTRSVFGPMSPLSQIQGQNPINRNEYHISDEESSIGTHRDFMWGILMGYFLGMYLRTCDALLFIIYYLIVVFDYFCFDLIM